MKRLFVILLIVSSSVNFIKCQSKDLLNLQVKDIELGLVNIDRLRIKLLENGFKFTQNEEAGENNTYRPEWWRYLIKDADKYDVQLVSISMILTEYANSKYISISINKELKEFASDFHNDVIKNFPEKKLLPGHEMKDGYLVEKGFDLYYFRKDSKIEIQYTNVDDFSYCFYWNYNLLEK
jgi:hypothetical protein